MYNNVAMIKLQSLSLNNENCNEYMYKNNYYTVYYVKNINLVTA